MAPRSHWQHPVHTGGTQAILVVPGSHWQHSSHTGGTEATLAAPRSHQWHLGHTGSTLVTLAVPRLHQWHPGPTSSTQTSLVAPGSHWWYLSPTGSTGSHRSDGTAVKERRLPAMVLGPQHRCANQDREKKCLKVVKVGGSPEGPMSPFLPCCPGWQQHKEAWGTRVKGK